ncbi:MAG: RNA 2',3'-cyclic phosphodiesterase [Candidatus Freyarchaeota archaeon]|nr:RNA 2',3'-cyclic phosphodiesterase [Candidatus Jordarchaeia archaeon]
MDGIRAFVAVDIQDQRVLEAVRRIQEELSRYVKAKFVELENFHFTLKFLGEVSEDVVDEVYNAMRELDFKSFELELRGVGCFPNLRRINVIWVGTREGGEKLTSLANELEKKLRRLGFKPEQRPFTPHATIARVKYVQSREGLASAIEKMRNLEIGRVTVDSLKLKRSQLTPRGPIYTTLRSIP